MTHVQLFARIYGIVFIVVGIMGLVPAFVQPIADTAGMRVDTGYGNLLGIFPVNILHDLVHAALGIWGILAARNFLASIAYAKANAGLYGVLGILGMIPATNTLFGLTPIYGADVLLHLLAAAIAGYFGFAAPAHRETPAAMH
jgi:hypothetical protein